MKTKKGFTLMEVIITIAILGIVLSILYNILFFQIKTFSMSDKKSVAQSDVRYISDFIANEIRYATDIEILQIMPKPEEYTKEDKESKIIGLRDKEVYYKNYGEASQKKLNIEDRNPSYILNFSTDKENILKFDLESSTENYVISSSINLINTKIVLSQGKAIRYKLPDFNNVLSFLDKSNRFWYDLVKASLEGTLNTATNYNSTQTVDGGVLALNIKSTGIARGGASMFVPLEEEAFFNAKGDIASYSITVDARVNGGEGGYGILINGVLNPQNQDSGYMFQFDPGAYGFVIREITDASHSTTTIIGAEMTSGNKYKLQYNAIYSPKHLENEKFKWTKDTWNSDSDWFKRYKTEIKAQTQSDGSLIIRAVIIDENGNRSNEMWFGDFGEITLNGSTFKGKNLGTYKNNGGNIFGLRVWDNKGGLAKTDFYNIAIGSAEPAPKSIGVTSNQYKLSINFDDKIDGDVALQKDNFVVKDKFGTTYEIQSVNKTGDDYSLQFNLVPQLDINGNPIPMLPDSSGYIVEYNKSSGSDGLKDSFGNTVTDFVFDKGFYIKQ